MLHLELPPLHGGFNPVEPRLRRPASMSRHNIRVLCSMGANMRIKFTKAHIEALEPPTSGEIFAWSENLPGWGVRILASGRKTWVVQYRDKDGRSKRHSIGDLRILPVSLAEQRAREILSHAKLGKDLLAEEKAQRQRKAVEAERSIGALVARYLVEPQVARRRSIGETKRYLTLHWQPVHALSAETVTRHDLAPTLRQIAATRGEIAANRARSALSGLFSHSIRHGWVQRDNSPTQYLPTWSERSRDRLLSIRELAAVWKAAPQVNETVGAIVRLLILSGCRLREVAELSWREIDLEKALITIPGSRTKGGRSVTIPLPPVAIAILEAVPRLSSPLVFPSVAWSHAKRKLDGLITAEGEPAMAGWVLHDLRRSCRSHWIDGEHGLGVDVHLCELMLGHALPGIIGVYDKATRLPERRRALTRWSELVLHAAGEPTAGAKVVSIR